MLRRLAALALAVGVAAAAGLWIWSAPRPLAAAALPAYQPDPAAGERMFFAAGCASCHAAPGAKGDDKLKLAGGLEIKSPFGLFRVPNISPDPDSGIGGWSDLEFVNAVRNGIAPDGAHYYPSFPYASYGRMRIEDILNLKAFMDTLPPVTSPRAGHDLPFPFNIRRTVGLWKRLFASAAPIVDPAGLSSPVRQGQYLVEGPGHCGECHTPRNFLGGLKRDAWLSGAANPDGPGRIPNITPHGDGLGGWSVADLTAYFETGFTPDFDTVGGSMVAVQDNLARLTPEDRAAIAAYLKAVPALEDSARPQASR